MAVLVAFATPVLAQSNFQTWYDFQFDYNITPKLLLSTEVGPKVLLSDDGSGWNAVDFSPGLEYTARPYLVWLFSVPLSTTVQAEGINTFEMRGSAGLRLVIQPNKRLSLRNRTLLEYRNLHYDGTDSTETSTRFRTRVEVRYAINRPTFASRKLLYGISDFEIFANLGSDPNERFLNRMRFRIGLGYRFDPHWAVEAIYVRQGSRNTLAADAPASSDNILRLRMIHAFN